MATGMFETALRRRPFESKFFSRFEAQSMVKHVDVSYWENGIGHIRGSGSSSVAAP